MSALSHIWIYWTAGGALLIPLAVVCFGIIFFMTRTQYAARRLLREGNDLKSWLAARNEQMDPSRLQAVLPVNRFSSVFHAALQQVAEGTAAPLDAIVLQEDDALQYLRRDMILLAALTAAAPLLGLLGTVGGMISTFDAVATVSGQTGTRVAGGISQALITTQYGLVVAMPGVFGMAHIRQRTRDVQLMLGECRAHLVALLSGGAPVPVKGARL